MDLWLSSHSNWSCCDKNERHKRSPFSLPLTVPFISISTHACVLHWQVPETHSHHPNPSSHIHSASNNSWRAGSFPASALINSGIRVSLFVLVRQGGRAACPCQDYTARWWRDLKQGTYINIISEKKGVSFRNRPQLRFNSPYIKREKKIASIFRALNSFKVTTIWKWRQDA